MENVNFLMKGGDPNRLWKWNDYGYTDDPDQAKQFTDQEVINKLSKSVNSDKKEISVKDYVKLNSTKFLNQFIEQMTDLGAELQDMLNDPDIDPENLKSREYYFFDDLYVKYDVNTTVKHIFYPQTLEYPGDDYLEPQKAYADNFEFYLFDQKIDPVFNNSKIIIPC